MPGNRAIQGQVSRGLGAYTGSKIVDLISDSRCKNIWNSSFVTRTINKIQVTGTIRNPNSQGAIHGYVQVKFEDVNVGSQAFTLNANATTSFGITSANPFSNVTAVSKITVVYSGGIQPLNAGVNITAEVIYPTITQYDLISEGAMEMQFLVGCGFATLAHGTNNTISHGTHFSGLHQSVVLSEGSIVSISTLNTIYNDISGSNLFTGVTK